jgi:hypothetical protein
MSMPDTGPSNGFLKRMLSKKRGDIELPNVSGRRDPRLPPKKPSLMEHMRKTKRKYNPFDRISDILREGK